MQTVYRLIRALPGQRANPVIRVQPLRLARARRKPGARRLSEGTGAGTRGRRYPMKQIFIAFPQSGEKNELDRETLLNEDIRCQNVAEPASVATSNCASYRRENRLAS